MADFFNLKVKEVVNETHDTVSVLFDVPQELESQFNFNNGQYITLKANINNEEVRRSYSLSSCLTTDGNHRIAVKREGNGKMSNWLATQLHCGDELSVMQPE